MRKLHKGLLIGGVTLAVLAPASLVAADQGGVGNGNSRGNGDMTQDCTGDQSGDQIRARDGSGPLHAAQSTGAPGTTAGNQYQSGPMDGSGPQADRPMDGTGNRWALRG